MKVYRFLAMVFLVLTVSVAVVFAAGTKEAPAQPGQVTIRYLVPQWASTKDARIERQVAFQSVIDSFQAQYPNVKLQEVVSTASNYDVDVANQINQSAVEVVWINNPFYPTLQADGKFVNLEPYLSPADKADFFAWTFDALKSVNGKLGGLWHNTDVRLFFYRTDLMPVAPKTYEELIVMAKAIKATKPGISPYFASLGHSDALTHIWGNFEALGGVALDSTGKPVLLDGANRALWERIFKTFKAMMDEGLIPESAALAREAGVVPLLLSGQVASFIANSNYGVREIMAKLPKEEAALWKAANVPGYQGTSGGRSVSGGWVFSARTIEDPAIQKAAIDFVIHSTNFLSQRNVNKAGGWTPTRSSVFTDDPFFQNDRFMVVANEALKTATVRPLKPIMPIIANTLAEALSKYLSGAANLQQALDAANRTIQTEYSSL
jgi:multiple sugar transport system substrate-binding protein